MANPGILRVFHITVKSSLLFGLLLICGCSFYSKPAYWGKVVDAETGEPIRKVNVVITYNIGVQRLVEQGTNHVAEFYLITDEKGRFETPPVRSIIGPLSWDEGVVFSIKRVGYAYLRADISECMSIGCSDINFNFHNKVGKEITISSHLIKLPKLQGE